MGSAASTVQDWVKKYGTEGLRRGLMVMQTAEERDQVKELQERNRQLEQLVAQLSLDKLMLESTVAVIERDYGIDVKKNGLTSSKKQASGKKQRK